MDELWRQTLSLKTSTAVYPIFIQLQLFAGRGHYHGDHHFSTCSVKSTDPGKGAALQKFVLSGNRMCRRLVLRTFGIVLLFREV